MTALSLVPRKLTMKEQLEWDAKTPQFQDVALDAIWEGGVHLSISRWTGEARLSIHGVPLEAFDRLPAQVKENQKNGARWKEGPTWRGLKITFYPEVKK